MEPAALGASGDPLAPRPGESEKEHEAFQAYWSLGKSRSIARVARLRGVSERTVARWATRFEWRDRVIHAMALVANHPLAETSDDETLAQQLDALKVYRFNVLRRAEALAAAAQSLLDLCTESVEYYLSTGKIVPIDKLAPMLTAAQRTLEAVSEAEANATGAGTLIEAVADAVETSDG